MDSIIPQDTPQKQCTKCLQWLPATLDYFYKARRGLLRAQCKACISGASKINAAHHVEDRHVRYQSHREERLEQAAQYREAHRHEVRASNRRYHEAHREELLSYNKQYYQSHQEELRTARRAYREAHREVVIAKGRAYYHAHREACHVRNRQYYEKNQEAIKQHLRQDRRKRPAFYHKRDRTMHQRRSTHTRKLAGTLTTQQIQAKLKAQKYACYYAACGHAKFKQRKDGTYVYHLDHTIPVSRPDLIPRHDADHVVLACPHCNQSKHNKLPHEWPEGGRLL